MFRCWPRPKYQIDIMDQREQRCPCGCPGMQFHEDRETVKIRTKEIVSPSFNEDRVSGPEVLRYQGQHYCAELIAPLWKKDCRMWLWKSSVHRGNKSKLEKEQRGC